MLKKYMIGTLVIGMIVGGNISTSNSYSINRISTIQGIKVVEYAKSHLYKSNIYTLANGCEVVINFDRNIYELYTEELADWSIECESYGELMEYVRAYSKHKNDYKKYDNTNIVYNEECCEYVLSNGITVVKSNDIDIKDVYLPIFGGLPYKCKDLNDAKNLIVTYIECINY